MNGISKVIKALYEAVKSPKLFNRILDDNEVWRNYVVKHHSQFSKGLPVVEIDDLLPKFKETLELVDFSGGGSTPPDLAIIKGLCRSVPNCKYFEIGTWRGESSVNSAEVSSECYTLNLPPTSFNGMYKDIFGFFSKNNPKIIQLYGDSTTFDYAGLNKKFDVIFIDGNHRYSYIKIDTGLIFKHLAHENSIVIWHDYGKDPATVCYETLAGILEGIPQDLKKNLYHVSNSITAICTNRKLPTKTLTSPVIPTKKFRVTLESTRL